MFDAIALSFSVLILALCLTYVAVNYQRLTRSDRIRLRIAWATSCVLAGMATAHVFVVLG